MALLERKVTDMNARHIKVPTRFARETRFELPIPSVPFRGEAEARLDALKQVLVSEMLAKFDEPIHRASVQRAASEAASLAWLTPYPLLVLPALLEEKAASAIAHADRQTEIRRKSQGLLALAA